MLTDVRVQIVPRQIFGPDPSLLPIPYDPVASGAGEVDGGNAQTQHECHVGWSRGLGHKSELHQGFKSVLTICTVQYTGGVGVNWTLSKVSSRVSFINS